MRRFGSLEARAPVEGDAGFLFALYLAARPDLGALPVPRGVIDGIARHQLGLQAADYARRFPAAETWLVSAGGAPVARLVLDWRAEALRVVDLTVAAGARRRGVARTLLTALQQECAGRRAIGLRVRAENAAARRLYEQAGFLVQRDDGATLELRWTGSPDDQNE